MDYAQQEKQLGIASMVLRTKLDILAHEERAEHPWEPRIHCRGPGCEEWAQEMWWFCSEDCRNSYVAKESLR